MKEPTKEGIKVARLCLARCRQMAHLALWLDRWEGCVGLLDALLLRLPALRQILGLESGQEAIPRLVLQLGVLAHLMLNHQRLH